MSLHLELVDFNQMRLMSKTTPFVLNDYSTVTEEDRALIERMTRTVYNDQDIYSNRPSCECGAITGGVNLGVRCKTCNTEVKELHEHMLEARVWMRSPHGVEKIINPVVWTMLKERFTKSNFNMIEWLCNTDYSPPALRPNLEIEELLACGVQRGYNNFVQNFDAYIDILSSIKHFSKKVDPDFLRLIREQRHAVFSTHLPLPNKTMLILENNHSGRWMDPLIEDILNAICNMQGIDTDISTFSVRQKENRTAKTIAKLANYYYNAYQELLAKKSGIIRKHALGTRCNFSTRAVISSNTRPHKYDELEISWGQGVSVFRLHLLNRLMKMGFTPNEGTSFLQEYTTKYHPLLDQMFQDLIGSTKDGKGFAVVFVRNPSLSRASTQAMWVTKIKTDPDDPTTSLSILAVVGFNARKNWRTNRVIGQCKHPSNCWKPLKLPHHNCCENGNEGLITGEMYQWAISSEVPFRKTFNDYSVRKYAQVSGNGGPLLVG